MFRPKREGKTPQPIHLPVYAAALLFVCFEPKGIAGYLLGIHRVTLGLPSPQNQTGSNPNWGRLNKPISQREPLPSDSIYLAKGQVSTGLPPLKNPKTKIIQGVPTRGLPGLENH